MFESLRIKFGLISKSYLDKQLDFAKSVGKRLDEHRETVEAIKEKTNLFEDNWHIGHMATQDDYLMRLYYIRYTEWPVDNPGRPGNQQSTGEFVRSRPVILGKCTLPEYNSIK